MNGFDMTESDATGLSGEAQKTYCACACRLLAKRLSLRLRRLVKGVMTQVCVLSGS